MENQTTANRVCLTGRFSYLLTKYISLPLIVILGASAPLIVLAQEHETITKWVIAIILSLFILSFGIYHVYSKLKKVYISPSGLIVDNSKISWVDVKKVYYPWIQPRMVVVTYKSEKRSKVIFTVLPFAKSKKNTSLLTYFYKMAHRK